jgi:hypothetical protein
MGLRTRLRLFPQIVKKKRKFLYEVIDSITIRSTTGRSSSGMPAASVPSTPQSDCLTGCGSDARCDCDAVLWTERAKPACGEPSPCRRFHPQPRVINTSPDLQLQAARRTTQGYEAVHMIRKGQIRWVAGKDLLRQIKFIDHLFDLAA